MLLDVFEMKDGPAKFAENFIKNGMCPKEAQWAAETLFDLLCKGVKDGETKNLAGSQGCFIIKRTGDKFEIHYEKAIG